MLELKEIKKWIEMSQGQPVRSIGLDQREINERIVQVYYYSVEYKELGTVYRWAVFVDDHPDAGGVIG